MFLDAYKSKQLPECLHAYIGPPDEFFIAADTQEPYSKGRLIPILDDGNFSIVTFSDPCGARLVQFDVESPQSMLKEFTNWQQYLADLLIRVGESIDDDARVRRIAALVEFRYPDMLFAFFTAAGDQPYEEYKRLEQQFVSSIAA